jgi:lipopolysaccharide biosynthesis regulator YciM
MQRLIDFARRQLDCEAAFDPSIMAEPALLNLGKCYVRLGALDRAESCFAPLLHSPPHQAEARQGYAMVQELRRKQP